MSRLKLRAPTLLLLAAVGGLVVAAAHAQQTVEPQTPVFRTSTDIVLVDVSVRARGRPVPGLTSDDFELKDNGVVQSIDSVSLETVPLDVTFLLDTSGSTDGTLIDRLKRSVVDTARLLRAQDRIRVLAIHHVVNEIIPLQPANQAPPVDRLQARGGTALFDGVAAALMRPSESGRRQLVIVYTDGDDASSILSGASVADLALRAETVVHVVLPTGADAVTPGGQRPVGTRGNLLLDRLPNGGAPVGVAAGVAVLSSVTVRTGGRLFAIDASDSVSVAFREVLEDYRTSYLLRYAPQGVPRAGWHEIAVRLKRPGSFEVRARKGWSG